MSNWPSVVLEKVEAYVVNTMQEERKIELLTNLSMAVEKVQNACDQSPTLTLTGGDSLKTLCDSLSDILHHGLRDKLATTAKGKTSFWAVIEKLSLKEDIQTIYRLPIVQSESNRCQVWIRMALKEHTIGSYFGMLEEEHKLRKECYHSYAFVRDTTKVASVRTYFQHILSSMIFDINIENINETLKDSSESRESPSYVATLREVSPRQLQPSRRRNGKRRTKQGVSKIAHISDDHSTPEPLSGRSSITSQSSLAMTNSEYGSQSHISSTPTSISCVSLEETVKIPKDRKPSNEVNLQLPVVTGNIPDSSSNQPQCNNLKPSITGTGNSRSTSAPPVSNVVLPIPDTPPRSLSEKELKQYSDKGLSQEHSLSTKATPNPGTALPIDKKGLTEEGHYENYDLDVNEPRIANYRSLVPSSNSAFSVYKESCVDSPIRVTERSVALDNSLVSSGISRILTVGRSGELTSNEVGQDVPKAGQVSIIQGNKDGFATKVCSSPQVLVSTQPLLTVNTSEAFSCSTVDLIATPEQDDKGFGSTHQSETDEKPSCLKTNLCNENSPGNSRALNPSGTSTSRSISNGFEGVRVESNTTENDGGPIPYHEEAFMGNCMDFVRSTPEISSKVDQSLKYEQSCGKRTKYETLSCSKEFKEETESKKPGNNKPELNLSCQQLNKRKNLEFDFFEAAPATSSGFTVLQDEVVTSPSPAENKNDRFAGASAYVSSGISPKDEYVVLKHETADSSFTANESKQESPVNSHRKRRDRGPSLRSGGRSFGFGMSQSSASTPKSFDNPLKKSGSFTARSLENHLFGALKRFSSFDSQRSSLDPCQLFLDEPSQYTSDSDSDSYSTLSNDNVEKNEKERVRVMLADLGISDDILGLKEDHFGTPESFMGFSSKEELEHAIGSCKRLIKELDESSPERQELIDKLVILRIKLQEVTDVNTNQESNGRKILGHRFEKENQSSGNHFCDHCGSAIWELFQTSLKCSECSFRCHKKCLAAVDKECVSQKVSETSCITDICPESGLSAQQYRCADCRRRLTYKDGQFECRLCDYTGKLYCHNCHWNESTEVPARIIHNWDFTPRKVSRQSKHLLNTIARKPIICIKDTNPALFNFVEELRDIRALREQILTMKTYLTSCRMASEKRMLLILKHRQHFVETADVYSLRDLIDVNSGWLLEELAKINAIFSKHIKFDCVLCQGKAFLCEICKSKEPIFPFEYTSIRCRACKAVFHRTCFARDKCPKCERISQRRNLLSTN